MMDLDVTMTDLGATALRVVRRGDHWLAEIRCSDGWRAAAPGATIREAISAVVEATRKRR